MEPPAVTDRFDGMLPIVVRTRKRIFRHYTGFSFFIFIWISDLENDRARLIRHEKIHFVQQLELLFVLHWLLYALFYVISRLKGHEHYIGYRYNPFELEAYGNDTDDRYLTDRRPFAWLKYWTDFRQIFDREKAAKLPRRKDVGFD